MKRLAKLVILAGSFMALFGCGGGGGGGAVQSVPQKTAVIKLSTTGTLPMNDAIAGIGIAVELPAGVTVKTDATGKVAAGTVAPSGVTEAKATITDPDYVPATATSPAKLSFVLASNEVNGFRTGEFATVTCDVASTASPAATDFIIPPADFKPVDLRGVAIPDLSVSHTVEIKQ